MDDEVFFEAVVLELERHGPRRGLWAKAFARTGGNSEAARALYIELRAKQLRDESLRSAKAQSRIERQRQETAEREARSKTPQYDALLALAQTMRRVGFSEAQIRERLVNRDVDGFVADMIAASLFKDT